MAFGTKCALRDSGWCTVVVLFALYNATLFISLQLTARRCAKSHLMLLPVENWGHAQISLRGSCSWWRGSSTYL